MSDRFFVRLQYLIPQLALTRFAGWVASGQWGWLTTAIIRRFVARYHVNMNEALEPDIARYISFNDFFTRTLKPEARPLAVGDWLCPVDGSISQLGAIRQGKIFQAKGHDYDASTLLGGDAAAAAPYAQGHFATLYLSPRDYHRIHMPAEGRLLRMVHVPGALFSVNPATAQAVPGLFARNERVVCFFESPQHGPFVLVLVGATIVGSMATVWHGLVNPRKGQKIAEWNYLDTEPIVLQQGQEMGRFLLGSTVVMLFPSGGMKFNTEWVPGRAVRLGEAMASCQAA